MRDNGKFLSGRKLTTPPQVFLGAAINPFAPPYRLPPASAGQEDRRRRAVRAEPVLLRRADVPRPTCRRCATSAYTEKCFILCRRRSAGLGQDGASWIRSNVPGIHIPDAIIKRLEGAQDQKKEGKQLCIDIINEVKEIPGVSGVHVMAYRQEEYVAEIVDESGVLKGRQPWKREIRRDDQLVADRLDHILHDDDYRNPGGHGEDRALTARTATIRLIEIR